MGIQGLWEVLGKGDEYAIEEYAAAHWEKHKRPLRIAVDEACWRFNNLTDEQVVRIREGEPAANPIEKTILYRILKFWRLNIQLIFVTDGLKKPGKKRWNKAGGRGGGRVDKAAIRMLHQLFDRLHVPYHEAPGEAEAECARMQQLGVVDAVWSDDGDCLMFGCTTLIKAHSKSGTKDWGRIQVYEAQTLLPQHDFDTDSLVMFAVLAGGDYDDKGLPGCGHQTARTLCTRKLGLAQSLRRCAEEDFPAWRGMLAATLKGMRSKMDVPPDFLYLKALDGYRAPAVSADDKCRNPRRLHNDKGGWEWWENQMDQTALRVVLRSHYNFQTREYLKHVASVFLARALTRGVTPARKEENLSYGVVLRCTQKRKTKDGKDLGLPAEINIKFDAARLVQINLSIQPPEEQWSSTVKNDGVPYDPFKPVGFVMLSCFLAHGLPEGALDRPAKAPSKKKAKNSTGAEAEDGQLPNASKAALVTSQQGSKPLQVRKPSSQSDSSGDPDTGQIEPQSPLKPTKKRKARSEVDAESSRKPVKKSRKSKGERTPSPPPPPATFRRAHVPILKAINPTGPAMPSSHMVIDLDDYSDSDTPNESVQGPTSPSVSRPSSQHTASARLYQDASARDHVQPSLSTATKPLKSAGAPEPRPTLPPANAYDKLSMSLGSVTAPVPLVSSFMVPPAPSTDQLGLPTSSAGGGNNSYAKPSASVLRQRRELGLLSKLSKPPQDSSTFGEDSASMSSAPPPAPPPKTQHEVIDLT